MNTKYRNSFWLAAFMIIVVSLACSTTTQTSAPQQISTRTPLPTSNATVPPNATPTKVIPTNPPPTPKPTNTRVPPTPTSIPAQYLGDAYQKDGFLLTAISIADPATAHWLYKPETGKKLIGVEVLVGNISGNILDLSPDYAIFLDNEGFAYPALGSVEGLEDEVYNLCSVTILPGEQTDCWFGFSIPETSVPATIKVTTDYFDDKYIQTSLLTPPDGYTPITIALTPNVPTAKLGDVVEQAGYSLTVVNFEDPTQQWSDYRSVSAEVIFENVSATDPISEYFTDFSLVDINGFVYPSVSGGREGKIEMIQLNIGEKIKGWVTFVIPADAVPNYIRCHLDLYSSNFLISGLTQ